MKVAYILPRIQNKGSISLFQILTNNLENEFDIFYLKDNDGEITFKNNPQKNSILKPIKFKEYDIIHSSGFIPDLYIFFWSFFYKFKKVTTVHSYIEEDLKHTKGKVFSIIISYLWKKIWIRYDKVFVLSKDAKKYYENLKIKTKVINSGCDIKLNEKFILKEDIEKINKLKKKYKIIGTNAILTTIKGIDQLILFLEKNKEYGLIIIGDGKEKNNLIQLAKIKNVYNRCLFLGYRLHAYNYIKFYNIYAMPSRSEGFGLALIEAMAQKKLLLCSDLPVFKELFTDEEVSFFELENILDMEKAIKKLEEHEKEYKTNSYNKYYQEYTGKKMAKRYLEAYKEILEKGMIT